MHTTLAHTINTTLNFNQNPLGRLGLLCKELTEFLKTETMLLSMASSLTLCNIPHYFVDTGLSVSNAEIICETLGLETTYKPQMALKYKLLRYSSNIVCPLKEPKKGY
jgi:hypothetical protein